HGAEELGELDRQVTDVGAAAGDERVRVAARAHHVVVARERPEARPARDAEELRLLVERDGALRPERREDRLAGGAPPEILVAEADGVERQRCSGHAPPWHPSTGGGKPPELDARPAASLAGACRAPRRTSPSSVGSGTTSTRIASTASATTSAPTPCTTTSQSPPRAPSARRRSCGSSGSRSSRSSV